MESRGNLHLAPPVKTIDGLVAVPIDIQNLYAHVIFDMVAQRASVEATLEFLMGVEDGNPIFDLRQNIKEAWINNEPIDIEKLRHHDFGGGPGAELIILEKAISKGSKNILKLHYELNKPNCPESQDIGWDTPRLYFEFWFTDLHPARYLEMWFPSNLIYDQFKFSINVEITNTMIEHILFSNGEVNRLSLNHWQIEFPESFTSLSPMLCILAKDTIEHIQNSMILPDNGSKLDLLTFKKLETSEVDVQEVETRIREYITKNVINIGKYIHGGKFITFIWPVSGRSMEYDGAVTTEVDALKHEIFHSWFGRGVKPRSQNDGWIDEAWDVYNTGLYNNNPFNMNDPPIMLSSSNPFERITPSTSYTEGPRFFATLASLIGDDNLHLYMRSFYQEFKQCLITTKQLESYLINKSGIAKISDYFLRFVYGLDNHSDSD